MKCNGFTALAAVAFGLLVSGVEAGEVTVKGVHLCCGACVRDVDKAMTDVDGVSAVAADRNSKTVTFQAANDEAAKAGIKALADGGFHGTASHGDKKIDFPASGAKKGAKADSVTLTGVHLCCGACVKGVQEALDGVDGVTSVDVDRSEKTVTLNGKDIQVAQAVDALNKGGFHGTVKQ